jgi:hypothetical protein
MGGSEGMAGGASPSFPGETRGGSVDDEGPEAPF